VELPKDPAIRLSKWSARTLSDAQVHYAALDVTVAIDIYAKLLSFKDLTLRMPVAECVVGTDVDIVPSRGSITNMATRGAYAKITSLGGVCGSPSGILPQSVNITPLRRVITVSKVLAPSLIIPLLKKDGKKVTLGDFGQVPFTIVAPVAMLAPHIDTGEQDEEGDSDPMQQDPTASASASAACRR
jgi:hypothetical protein